MPFSSSSVQLDSSALAQYSKVPSGGLYKDYSLSWDEQTLQQTYFRRSARCVQSFDDSLDFAIRMTYRISLRSSSLW